MDRMKKCVDRFADHMKSVLKENDGKKFHWSETSLELLESKLTEEFVELYSEMKAMRRQSVINAKAFEGDVRKECVDLANICMMIYDKLILDGERITDIKRAKL